MTETTTKAICVWLDDTADDPTWIVSLDEIIDAGPDAGGAATTRTLSTHDDQEEAEEEAREQSRRRKLPLYRNDGDCPAEPWTSPRTILISDGIGHLQERLTLRGATLDGSDFVLRILRRNGCEVVDTMGDDAIADAVRDAFAGDGYEGDPDENGLTVAVEAE